MEDKVKTEPFISYASSEMQGIRRSFIKIIEAVSGRPKLKRVYDEYMRKDRPSEKIWQDIIKLLNIDVKICNPTQMAIPKTGALLVVANHPLGILDGVAICSEISKVRPDFKIVAHRVLAFSDRTVGKVLPISFDETEQALRTNIDTRRQAIKLLQEGGVIMIFPAGAISLAPKVFDRAVDEHWKGFTSKLAVLPDLKIMPVFFHEQNSALYQLCRRVSVTLGYSLMFREVKSRMNKPLNITYQRMLDYSDLKLNRKEILSRLRKEVYKGTELN